MADSESKPHEIQPLNKKKSKQLLLKKVFPNQFANECPNNLFPLITQFTKKCDGWPLPLVLLGGILSRKKPNYIEWDEVMQNLDWQNMGSSVISTSYEDLPADLKTCFMYFGVFPKDYQIKATTLIQLWIAEGFIPKDGTKLLEDIAESYLEELVQRCMVQVSRRSCIGKIKYCYTHDLLRHLAIQKAKEDKFLMVVTEIDTELSCNTYTRRVALHGYGDKVIEHACKENIRSLINFEDVPKFNGFEMLRILHMGTVPEINLRWIKCLMKGLNAMTTLKYFGFEGDYYVFPCFFRSRCFRRFPLTNMKNLQTVSTWFCKGYGELSSSFWGNKQLRHINLTCCNECDAIPEGPPSVADLQSLLTLKGVRARQDWVACAELPKFPYLRKLGIVIPEDVEHEPLIELLSNLNYLGSLHLEMTENNRMVFPDCISAFRNHNRLHSLRLVWGKWTRRSEDGDYTLFPPNLVKLIVECFDFEVDPMPQLEKLPNLTVLKLFDSCFRVADENRRMVCSRGGFGCLQLLSFNVIDLEEWKIEEGAMPILNQLHLKSDLPIGPDLQNLVNLQVFTVKKSSINDTWLEGEDQWKIKLIPSVNIEEPPACNIM